MLIELFESKDYNIREAAQGRYMKGLVPLLGGQYELDILRDDHIVRLLSNAQIRKGRAYTLKELTQITMPDAHTSRFMQQMSHLTGQGAFIRGYRLQCPTCDLDTWYALDDVAEQVLCEGCRIRFQLPLDMDFAFRPNRLLMEATKSGALTLLLTLYHWLQDSPITLWLSGLEIANNSIATDIDLIAQREDGLFVAECKDNFKLEKLDDLLNQLKIGKSIADTIGANYVFATLFESQIPQKLQAFCDAHAIQILSRATLLDNK